MRGAPCNLIQRLKNYWATVGVPVLGVFVASVVSVAVTVQVPEEPKATVKALVPLTRAALVGMMVALISLEVTAIMFVAGQTFQYWSTAFTRTSNGTPGVWAVGVPVLPVVVPGAAVSPGIKTCSFTYGYFAIRKKALLPAGKELAGTAPDMFVPFWY